MKFFKAGEHIVTLENVKEIEIKPYSTRNDYRIEITYWNTTPSGIFATNQIGAISYDTATKWLKEMFNILLEKEKENKND